jgi:hypothetical protein
MRPEVTLTVRDEHERARVVDLSGNRFTIGRSPDNDLSIDDRGLSRRHALIETFDGIVQISDCGSQNGTFVNGVQVRGSIRLNDGDVISIGNACEIEVRFIEKERAAKDPISIAAPSSREEGSTRRWASTPVIAVAAMVLIMLVTVPVALLIKGGGKSRRARPSGEEIIESLERGGAPESPARIDPVAEKPGPDPGPGAISLDQIERSAAQVMRRVSSDDKPYVFPSGSTSALADIRKKIEEYRASPSVAGVLNSLRQRAPEIAMRARREGIAPDLVLFTALAETDGGRKSAEPSATALAIMPELLSLKATFGTEMADKSLILVAAYRMGGGTRKSHPLLATMRRLVNNPLRDRNVWYLHERGGLDADVYNFVLSFIALGIIAQNPSQYGIAASPLAS